MRSRRASSLSRRLPLLGGLVLGIFLLFDLGLFGWLIFRSLSEREIENLLVETREQAQGIAERLAGRASEEGEDLYTAVASQRETLTYIDSVLSRRDFVYTVEIRDRDGLLVFKARTEGALQEAPGQEITGLDTSELPPDVEQVTNERQSTREVSVPIGDLGFLRIGISQGVLEERVGLLRRELLRQILAVGALTLLLLLVAYSGIWWLWRRGRRLEEQAAEAESLAALGTLASGLAHEIRNPLNSLSLNMQMLEEEMDGRPAEGSGRQLMAITRSEIGRLERLVTDFLTYARPRPLELEEVPAADLLDRARQVLDAEARTAGVVVSVVDRTGGAQVRVDAGQASQLLLNLLRNAIVATEGIPRAREVVLEVRRREEHIVVAVRDNGRGIPEEEREKVFELFHSTRRGGTGLGLAIAQRISRAHGAEIELDSEIGRGTEIRVVLPEARIAAPKGPK